MILAVCTKVITNARIEKVWCKTLKWFTSSPALSRDENDVSISQPTWKKQNSEKRHGIWPDWNAN
jgi:hypothetical protein